MWMAIFSQEKTFVNVMFMVCFQFRKKKSCATWWQPFAETDDPQLSISVSVQILVMLLVSTSL
jgi:hypothetical protein